MCNLCPRSVHSMRVKVVIMSGTGYAFKTYDQVFPAGLITLYWDGKGPEGKPVESGLIIVSILTEDGYHAKMFTIL